MPDKCVNLIYIDPPFFTQKNYKNIWGDKESVQDYGADFFNGFEDTRDFFERHINSDAKGLKAFLEWIRARFVECERILKDSGSFYLHLDYHTVHYAKVMLDEIFGYKNFRNEIIWRRKKGSNATKKARRFSTNSDTILFYTKSKQYLFDLPYLPHDEEYVKKTYKFDDNDGRGLYRLGDLSAPSYSPTLIYDYKEYKPPRKGWRYNQSKMKQMDEEGRLKFPTKETGRIQQKRYLSEMKGNPVENIWFDIGALQDKSPEKTGWPTQKPVALLERIISSSSKEGDIVFDCFAGCGTAMHAAHNLKRKWIGIDISPTAIRVNQERLEELGAKVNVVDENDLPVNLVEQKRRKSLKEAA
jgi:site-specific DNA-methyltransferase (adenine-specific)